jgi:hypothetical protein
VIETDIDSALTIILLVVAVIGFTWLCVGSGA